MVMRLAQLLVALAMFALAACGGPGSPEGTVVLRRGLGGEPSSLDPAKVADAFSAQVVEDLYEGLTVESPSGEAVPGVASSWAVDSTGRQYTFHLRPTARWSNGKPVRASEFVSAWRRVVDPKTGSALADDLRSLLNAEKILQGKAAPDSLGVAAPDEATLVVTLELPAPYLPEILSHTAALPIYSQASATARKPDEWVSNGPYVLKRWRSGTDLELTKNPQYWDAAHVAIPSVAYVVSSDEAAQYARYRAGELDMTDTIPAAAIQELRKQTPGEVVIAPYLGTAYYGLNLKSKKIGDDVRLRQALSMAIDRKRLVDSFGFGQQPAYALVPPGVRDYTLQSVPWSSLPDDQRISEAQRLYAQAGFSRQSPLRVRVLYNSNTVIQRTAIMIASMWKEALGVESELIEQEYRSFLVTRHDTSQWDVARLAWVADFNDASNFLDIVRSGSTNNDENYANAAFDNALDSASKMADPLQRRALLETAEKGMLDDYPIIPLYHYVSKRLVKSYVSGVAPTPLDRVPSKALSLKAH